MVASQHIQAKRTSNIRAATTGTTLHLHTFTALMMTDETDENKDVEVQEESTEAAAESGSGMTMAGLHVADHQLPMVGMFFFGLIVLIAVLSPGRGIRYWAYGVSLASVAMVFALVGFFVTLNTELNDTAGKFIAAFLFLWCFIGACIMTFAGPFTMTGNGYFASWGLAVASIVGVGVTGSQAKSVLGRMGALLGLGASSIVVIIAIIPEIQASYYRNTGIYALVVACCTVCIVAALSKSAEKFAKVKFVTLAFFAILWIVLACLCTFRGPFLVTGNGYFASWGGAITSVVASMAALKE